MVTAVVARTQLSRDLGDYFASTTTGNASCADELVDTALLDQDADEFLTKRTTVWIAGSQCGGPASNEERRVDRNNSVMTTGTLNFFRDWSATLQAAVDYEVHHLFTAAEKDAAITVALDLVPPILWASLVEDVTMVTDQYDYDISCLGFRNNRPHDVHRVSTADTELTVPVHNWEIRDDTDLHIKFRPRNGETLRLYGIKNPTLSDIVQPQLLILTARAAMYLLETALQSTRVDQRTLFQALLQQMTQNYGERVRQHMKPAPAKRLQTEAFESDRVDTDFRIP